MCHHTPINANAPQLEERYGTKLETSEWQPVLHANAFSFPRLPLVCAGRTEKFLLFHWGLIPHWVKDGPSAQKLRTMTANCRFETMYEKPSFRGAAGAGRRCLIPVTGFFEWQTQGKKKYPFYIHPKEGIIVSIAGIWDEWADPSTGEVLTTYSMLSGPANPMMAKIHNGKERMPCLLSTELEDTWLNPSLSSREVLDLLTRPYPDQKLGAHTVSRDIISHSREDAKAPILQPYAYPELADLSF